MSECTHTHSRWKTTNILVLEADDYLLKILKMWNFAFNPGHPWWWEAKNISFLLAERSVIIQRRKGIHNCSPFLVGSYWAQPTASFSIWVQHSHLPSIQKLGWYLGTKLLLFLVSERSWHQQKSYFQVSHSRATNLTIPWDWTLLCELAWVLPRVVRENGLFSWAHRSMYIEFRHQQIWILIQLCLWLVVCLWVEQNPHLIPSSHCATGLIDGVSGPHKNALGTQGRLSGCDSHHSISPISTHSNFAFILSRFGALKLNFGTGEERLSWLGEKKSIKNWQVISNASFSSNILWVKSLHGGRVASESSWGPFDYFAC